MPIRETNQKKTDPYEVLNDGLHFAVSQITPENQLKVCTDPNEAIAYTFFSQFSGSTSQEVKNFFGIAQRHGEFERAIEQRGGVSELLCRGQIMLDPNNQYVIIGLFESSAANYFSKFTKKQLRKFLLDFLDKIDHRLLASKVMIQLNGLGSYAYFPRHRMLRPYKGGRVGTFRF